MSEEVVRVPDRPAFRSWLEANHTRRESVWLELSKRRKGVLKHAEALEEALCFGWIDSLIKRVDEEKYLVKFSRRREKSRWSEKNKKLAQKLIDEGRMAPPGLAKVAAARKSGEWGRKPAPLPEGRIEELARKLSDFPDMFAAFNRATPAVRKLFAAYYFSAKKEETRVRRLIRIVSSLKTGRPIL